MSFPPGSKTNPIQSSKYKGPEIKPGSVVFCYSPQAKKFKRSIVLAINETGVLAFTAYFNSEKPFPNIKKLTELQFHLKAEGTSFLDHDSYINCAHPEKIPIIDIQKSISSNRKNHMGNIDPKKLDEIRTMVTNAYTVAPKTIKVFGLGDYIIK
jgi:hypothetical protein